MANIECYDCENLVREMRMTRVKRDNEQFDTAVSYSCWVRKIQLPEITKDDLPGCPFWKQIKV